MTSAAFSLPPGVPHHPPRILSSRLSAAEADWLLPGRQPDSRLVDLPVGVCCIQGERGKSDWIDCRQTVLRQQ
eukprot:355623-Chlamydomonas_euryale.AAC.10